MRNYVTVIFICGSNTWISLGISWLQVMLSFFWIKNFSVLTSIYIDVYNNIYIAIFLLWILTLYYLISILRYQLALCELYYDMSYWLNDRIILTTYQHVKGSFIRRRSGIVFFVRLYFYSRSYARGVMVIVLENGHGGSSSNPGRDWLHFT